MSVNWYWKHKVGEIHYYSKDDKQHWKVDLYSGNMMCAIIYRYKENGTKMYRFNGFLNDIEHAQRILADDKDFFRHLFIGNHVFRKFRLCVTSKDYDFSNKEMLKFAKLLAKYDYKVELY